MAANATTSRLTGLDMAPPSQIAATNVSAPNSKVSRKPPRRFPSGKATPPHAYAAEESTNTANGYAMRTTSTAFPAGSRTPVTDLLAV